MIIWVFKQVLLILTGCFFLVFGISVLIQAYSLKDPFSFVLTFFASNLMILISAAILIGLVLRLVAVHRHRRRSPGAPAVRQPPNGDESE